MRIYFGGAEIQSHRNVLDAAGARHVAMSYMGLARRNKFTKPWLVSEKFPTWMSVFLDSGAYTINTDTNITEDRIDEINEHYQDFVRLNLDSVNMVSEFDALTMGLDWIEEQRDTFWKHVPKEKFMSVWHPVWGLDYLHEMASRFEVIGIPASTLEGRELRPVLNALTARGTRLHGIAMTKKDEMQAIRWDSVASNSWISPQRYGDTIVWTGKELKRYPMRQKDVARKRHRTLFADEGFDVDKIEADDPTEVLRLSVWSWLKFEEYVNRMHKSGNVVTTPDDDAGVPNMESDDEGVDTLPDSGVTKPSTSRAVTRYREPTEMLPGMALMQADKEDDESPRVLTIRSESARVCDTCFLAKKCPMFEPGSNCAYNLPIQIRTREQLRGLHQGMLELQTQRVMFMRFAEETEGGYADPNLTKEINLLNKMLKEYAEAEREGFSLNVNVRGSGDQAASSGMMSRLFGAKVGQQVQELPAPVQADDVIDVEFSDETDQV